MLETSSKDIVFIYKEDTILIANLGIRSLLANSNISFKIKATTPDNFQVNPSRGILLPGQSKAIEFKTSRIMTKTEVQSIVQKEKFLIQCIPVDDKNKSEEIEPLWVTYKNDPVKMENTKLKLRVQGVEPLTAAKSQISSGGSQIRATVANKGSTLGMPSNIEQSYSKYQQWKDKQEYSNHEELIEAKITKKPSKAKSIVSKIFVLTLVFLAGVLFGKFVLHQKSDPSRVIITHSPEAPIHKEEEHETQQAKHPQVQVKKTTKQPGPKRIIVTSQQNEQVVLTNDNPDGPIRLTVKTKQMEDGTQKVIIG